MRYAVLTTRQEICKESVISKSVLNLSLTPKTATDPGPWGRSGKTGFWLNLTPVQGGDKAVEPLVAPPSTVLTVLAYEETSRLVAPS